jgi:RNA polymerase sigma factor (sigma-70 family)
MTDPARLAEWFEAHAATLVLYARQWLREPARAEDVVQEVFVRLMAQRQEPPNVKAWLHASVRNAAISESRSARRRRRREQSVAAERGENWFDRHPSDLLDAGAVQDALQHLPQQQREIVVMRLWSGMTLSEIAQITGLAVSTCFDDYRRALGAIRTILESRCTTTTTTTPPMKRFPG